MSLGLRETSNPLHLAYETYFLGRSEAVTRAIDEALGEHFSSRQPDVIYAYWFYLCARVAADLRARRGWQSPLVSRAHGYDVNVHASPVKYLPQRRALLEEVTSVHPVSDAATRYLTTTYPHAATKVSTRRLGTPPPNGAVAGRQKPATIVTCSMIRPLKRLDLVGEAVQLLRDRGHDVRWTHVGSGASGYASSLRSRYENAEHVSFLGYVPNRRIFKVYQELRPTAFVNMSTSEGVPVSVMEAMACGVPPIATDVGGTAELLGPDLTDWLLPADAGAAQLAERLETRILDASPREYELHREEARGRWAHTADGDLLYRAFASELRALCR
ncbi:glycosyltransferase [Knoellia sp. LjRoot47]|uniref:glycosyltransferase n=1 Tax=Knoellia sp. LjRoot47 TaxID=3342330 RepID=UPI003ECD0FEE